MIHFTHPSKEEIYDSKIVPLVNQLSDLCAEHEMSTIIVVHCPSHTRPAMCATSMRVHEDWGAPEGLIELCEVMQMMYNLGQPPKEPTHEDHEPLPPA